MANYSMTENEALKTALEKVKAQKVNFGFMERFNVDENWEVTKALEEIQQYRAIGTVEECRVLKEKKEPKKPLLRLCGDCQRGCVDCDRYEDRCPTCNGGLYVESGKPHKHCPNCGQKLDWE